MEPGTNALNNLVAALKMMGADEVYDTNFGADLTVLEESAEFLERLKKGGPFPMFTSCCPAWIKYLEKENPANLKNVSSCKSIGKRMQRMAAEPTISPLCPVPRKRWRPGARNSGMTVSLMWIWF